MANFNPNTKGLKPVKKGEVRNPYGRPKGSINFKDLVKNYAQDPKIADAVIKNKPDWWRKLPNRRMADAIVVSMMVRAMQGDVRAATWVRDTGFTDVITDVEPSEPTTVIHINRVPARERKIIEGEVNDKTN
jgi:hypothetical protein